jgi:D-alanine transaminase
MSRIAYVNGRYVPHNHAVVSIDDRGYQFSDGVYEVIAIFRGRMVDTQPHFQRLERSLSELDMEWPMDRAPLEMVIKEVIRRNRVQTGIVYLQITRGVARRIHAFPDPCPPPALVVTACRMALPTDAAALQAGTAITLKDIRWKRPDIKSVSLLPNILGKQKALDAGSYEALLVDDGGFVTEATASNAWIVNQEGELITRSLDNAILGGITRLAVIEVAARENLVLRQRAFSVEEALAAREVFVSNTVAFVKPIIAIDGKTIGDGQIGPMARKLQAFYIERMKKDAAP